MPTDLTAERRLRQLMDASLPVLLEMLAEHRQHGGIAAEVAGCVLDAEAAKLGKEHGAEAFLVPREKALEIAQAVCPDHAPLLAAPAPPGRFHVVAVARGVGAVVELSLPDPSVPVGEA
jgi:hypothetical protein